MENREVFADEIFGFHVQQAAEKALKAWLSKVAGDYPLTHDLTRLLMLLENKGSEVERFWPLTQYNIYAVQARYEEGFSASEEPIDRQAATGEIQILLEQIEKIVKVGKDER